MASIPFSLVGILPAHGLMGAFFSATSMIGFMAGAGIVLRNSIILVDFIEQRLAEGMPLDQAVVDAGEITAPEGNSTPIPLYTTYIVKKINMRLKPIVHFSPSLHFLV